MDKAELLNAIQVLTSEGRLSRDDVLQACKAGTQENSDVVGARGVGNRYSSVLSFAGGGIVFMGIAIFIAQQWDGLNAFMHILVTLGLGIAAYFSAILFSQIKQVGSLDSAFFLIAALLLPLGIGVTLDELGFESHHGSMSVIIFLIMSAVYALSFSLFKRDLLLLFAIIFSTCLYFGLINYVLGPVPLFNEASLLSYAILFAGISYMMLGYVVHNNSFQAVSGFLYGFGVLAFLGGAFSLGGWESNQNMLWELLFPGLVFLVFYLSTVLKSKSFLIFAALFLGSYIIKITAEYFSDSLGWPLALIIAGLGIIALGYFTLRVSQRYL